MGVSPLATDTPGDSASRRGFQLEPKADPDTSSRYTGERPKRILVVDDHPMMRVGAVTMLREAEDCEVVGEADHYQEALQLALSLRVDIVLTDIRLKGERTGIDLARSLRAEAPEIKILVLTNYPHEPYVRAMMELEVEGYLLKDTPPAEILEAVRMVMRGRNVYSATISSGIVRGFLSRTKHGRKRHGDELTSREAEILQLMADGRTNDDIAEMLRISVKGVRWHLSSLYQKLGVGSRSEAIVQAARRGLVILEEPD